VAASFGGPISLRMHLADGGTVTSLGEKLMTAIGAVVPVLPVPLVAEALGQGASSRDELIGRIEVLIERLKAAGAALKLPTTIESVLQEGLDPLIKRGLVSKDLKPVANEVDLLAFYAASVRQILT
jgi:glycerol-3-phosphate O-acyltransferase